MKPILLSSLFFFLLFAACSIQDRLDRKEDRLLGAWIFERATYKEDGDLFKDNVSNEFDGDVIEFFPNYTAVYDDASSGALFDGDWEIFADRDYNDGERDVEFFLDLIFYDRRGRAAFTYNSTVTRLDRNDLYLTAHTRSGFYKFRLRRLE